MNPVETIRQAQSSVLSEREALRALESKDIHGAFGDHKEYCGYDYTNQTWIAVHANGTTY